MQRGCITWSEPIHLHKSIHSVFQNKCLHISTEQVISFLDYISLKTYTSFRFSKLTVSIIYFVPSLSHMGQPLYASNRFSKLGYFTFFYSSVFHFLLRSFYSLFILHELSGLLSLLHIAR